MSGIAARRAEFDRALILLAERNCIESADKKRYHVAPGFSRRFEENYRDLIGEVPETYLGKIALAVTLLQYTQKRPVTDEEFAYMSGTMKTFFTPRSNYHN